MPKLLVQLLAALIPVKKYRREFRNKFLPNNKQEKYIRYIDGRDNILICPEGFKLNCAIIGNGNKVHIDENDLSWNTQLDVYVGCTDVPANNCTLKIGKNFSSNGTMIRMCEDNTEVTIGDDCMFSDGVNIWASDTHTITDLSGKDVNIGKFIHIGSHVWLGHGVTVLKNSIIPNGCVGGAQPS